jgi:SAM-dependent methyltransferase
MHPRTAQILIEALSERSGRVLDPFCGSGTVAIAGRELGRLVSASDLNPLGVELARLKSGSVDQRFVQELGRAADIVVEHASERQRKKLGPTLKYGPEDRALFAPYVLLALDGLRDGIDHLDYEPVEPALRLVLSSILTKLSQKTGDAAEGEVPKRIARSFPFRFFLLKTGELGRQLLQFSALVPPRTPPARIQLADARELRYANAGSIDLIVTSPPYPGVYDYYAHHELRLRWLRLDARGLERNEIGARRTMRDTATAQRPSFERDFAACFREMQRVLRRGGRAVLLIADSVVHGRAAYADRWVPAVAEREGLRATACASQERPYFHAATAAAFRDGPRREHLIVLEKR